MNRIEAWRDAVVRWRRDRRGIAALEFAIAAPFFVLVMLATADLAFYVRTRLKLDTAATALAEITTQYTQLYTSDFATLFQAAQLAAGSVAVSGQFGATIISGITNAAGTPVIAWQQISGGSGFKSQFGAVGQRPSLPGGYVAPIGVSVIVTELYTTATPWVFSASIMGGSGTAVVGSVALFQPRLALLATITTGTRP